MTKTTGKSKALPKNYRAAVAAEIAEWDGTDIGKHLQLVKLAEKTGRLVDRRLAEVVIERHVSELCKRLTDATRQIINLAGGGKTREQKLVLERQITKVIDSTLVGFRDNLVIPEPHDIGRSDERNNERRIERARRDALR